MTITYTIDPVAECSILVTFDAAPSPELSSIIQHCGENVQSQLAQWLMNVTPSHITLLIDYLPHRISIFDFIPRVERILDSTIASPPVSHSEEIIELPVYYHPDVGPDLAIYFEQGMTLDEVIELHTQECYSVTAIGFAPGFAFMSQVTPQLQLPRQSTPRVNVPKGSVAIANHHTAVYPSDSPGGWNIIGRCPLALFTPDEAQMLPYSVGSQVHFKAVDRDQFLQLGGSLDGEFAL